MEGFVLVTNPYYRWYFISFWTIAVIVILNLVIAFVLEAFFQKDAQHQKDTSKSSVEEDENHQLQWSSSSSAEEQHHPTLTSLNVAGGGGRGGGGGGTKLPSSPKYNKKKNVIHLHQGFM